jgi:DNA-binding NarL/FixJ family response regulator
VAAVLAGAAAYLLKGAAPEQLIEAVERAARGESLLDPVSTRTVLDVLQRQASGAASDPLGVLSDQEKRVLPLIAQGMTNRQIAEALFVSDQTVKGYVSSILKKLRLSRRAEAAAFAARHAPPAPLVPAGPAAPRGAAIPPVAAGAAA